VRRAEQKSRTELNNSRYLWLKNPHNLSERRALSWKPLRLEAQDRSGIPYAPGLPGTLPPARQERRGVPQEMVLVGHPQAACRR
jgi:hypothetical protein